MIALFVAAGALILGSTAAGALALDSGEARFVYDSACSLNALDYPSVDSAADMFGVRAVTCAAAETDLSLVGTGEPASSVDGHVYDSSSNLVAPSAARGGDLVPFDPEWASRQIAGQNFPGATGYASTLGGRTLSVHGAERIYLGAPGRNPVDPALVDSILDTGTRVGYRPGNATVKVSAPDLCGRCYVVVDADTGTHVVTVMIPK